MIQMYNDIMIHGLITPQQYILQKVPKKIGDHRVKVATNEVDQLQKLYCFYPINIGYLYGQGGEGGGGG